MKSEFSSYFTRFLFFTRDAMPRLGLSLLPYRMAEDRK